MTSGAIWIGTDTGAAWMANGKSHPIKETSGKAITAIVTPRPRPRYDGEREWPDFRLPCSNAGAVDARCGPSEGVPQVSFTVQAIPTEPLQSADKDQPGPLKITSLAMIGDKLYAGHAKSRIVLVIENGEVKEIVSRPRSFFINALGNGCEGTIVGGRARRQRRKRDLRSKRSAEAGTGECADGTCHRNHARALRRHLGRDRRPRRIPSARRKTDRAVHL